MKQKKFNWIEIVSVHYQVYKKVYFEVEISQEIHFQIRLSGSFWKTMPMAFQICYLKSLCIFPNELKLQPKIPQISRKCLEAKFRGRFRQVQQVNVKEKNYGQFPGVFIKLYKKVLSNFHNKMAKKKTLPWNKKIQFDRDSVSTLPSIQKSFFLKWKYLRNLIFKSVFQGVFWKDNAKGFLNLLSKGPVRISKWVKITIKDTPNFKKMIRSQVQRPFSPSLTSEHQGQKLWQLPGVFIKLYKKF